MSATARTYTCPTCQPARMRRRDCKHIRLILEQLAVADAPQDWEQVRRPVRGLQETRFWRGVQQVTCAVVVCVVGQLKKN
jgi:hypothetical protein